MLSEEGFTAFDPAAVHAKYLAERDKRLVPGRAIIRDLTRDEYVAGYRADPFTQFADRGPTMSSASSAPIRSSMRRRAGACTTLNWRPPSRLVNHPSDCGASPKSAY